MELIFSVRSINTSSSAAFFQIPFAISVKIWSFQGGRPSSLNYDNCVWCFMSFLKAISPGTQSQCGQQTFFYSKRPQAFCNYVLHIFFLKLKVKNSLLQCSLCYFFCPLHFYVNGTLCDIAKGAVGWMPGWLTTPPARCGLRPLRPRGFFFPPEKEGQNWAFYCRRL